MALFANARNLMSATKRNYEKMQSYEDLGFVDVPLKGRKNYVIWFETSYRGRDDFCIRVKLPHPSVKLKSHFTDMEVGISDGNAYVRTERPKKGGKVDYPPLLRLQ